MRGLAGKVALVTAGANGIGKASCLGFARAGASVLVSDIDDNAGRAVVEEIREMGGNADFLHCDVTSEDQVQELVDGALSRFGGLDFAHNNAGRSSGPPEFGGASVDDWNRTIDLCLRGTWLCMRAELPVMKERGGGVIVNTSSMAGVRTSFGAGAPYSAAKRGVISLTEYAAVHYASHNIRVNAIAPGLVRTAEVKRRFDKQQQDELAGAGQLIKRIIEPEEIADTVLFLCSDHAAMITGTTVPVSGGGNAA